MFAQEHFAATSLPAQVIHIVDVTYQVSVFEAYDVPVLVSTHYGSIITAKASELSTLRKDARYVRIFDCPAPSSIQPSGRAPANTSGRSCNAPDFFRHSIAHQTRVAATLASSPLSRAISSASAKRSGPSRSRHTAGVRAETDSRSHPAALAPATAPTTSPAYDAETRCPLPSGLPSGRLLTAARNPTACSIAWREEPFCPIA